MNNEINTLNYQIQEGNTKVDVRLEDGTIWMTQKAIAELYQTTPQNITLHIKNIFRYLDEKNHSCYFTVIKKEGSRNIRRSLLHYDLDVVFNIAIRGQYFEEITKLISFAKINGVTKEFLKVSPIKERNFGEILKGSLEGIVDIFQQYRVDKYFVDFYIPELKLVVEYDEMHHRKQIENDRIRQMFIEEKLKVQFIRVKEGEEVKGLNRIMKHLLQMR